MQRTQGLQKRNASSYAYQSGGRDSQIDFILVGACEARNIDCKTLPYERATTQHWLLVTDMKKSAEVKRKPKVAISKIKWWKLKEVQIKEAFRSKMSEREYANWEELESALKAAGRQVCSMTKGDTYKGNEAWWWDEEVKDALKVKKEAYKQWKKEGTEEWKRVYSESKRAAMKVVAIKKAKVMEDLYNKLDSCEGEKMVYRVARGRDQRTRDNIEGYYMKDTMGELLISPEENRSRWREYFCTLLNEERPHIDWAVAEPSEMDVEEITASEVSMHLSKMANNKAVETDDIPVEASHQSS